MSSVRIEVATSKPYAVHVGRGVLADLPQETAGARVAVLTDRNVAELHGRRLGPLADAPRLVLEPGERSKELSTLERVLDFLVAERLDQDGLLVAFGGGVVSDVGGLAAALYHRGIDWVACPTTLLAQVDAAVGGKTAVNLVAGKNLAGAFHQPRGVLADVDVLDTLPEEEFASGLGEVLKSAWVGDPELFQWLEEHASELRSRDPEHLAFVVERCVRVKADVVSRDELEGGARRALNLGHTFAHAIELAAGFGRIPHGVAVAVGIDLALRASRSSGLLAEAGWVERNARLLADLGLPADLEELRRRAQVPLKIDALMSAFEKDKKNASGRTRWVLMELPGVPRIDCPLEDDLLRELLA